MAAAEPSFNTSICAISFGETLLRSPWTPSMMTKGKVPELSVATPRNETCEEDNGLASGETTAKPATLPLISPATSGFVACTNSLAFTLITELVSSSLRCVPYPITTTSSSRLASSFNTTFTDACPFVCTSSVM